MPPLACLLLAGLGALERRRRPRLGGWLLGLGFGSLVAFSLPLVSSVLLIALQSEPALDDTRLDHGCGAIVVLAGDASSAAPEYGGPTCGPMTLERLRYAAHLARATKLPLLASGGVPKRGLPPHAEMMRAALERDFGLEVRWSEPRSANTRENARFSALLLRNYGINRAYVVTHAWHMPRALAEFRAAGLEAVAAPTGFRAPPSWDWSTFVPSAKALRESSWALHEWLGRAWYALTG